MLTPLYHDEGGLFSFPGEYFVRRCTIMEGGGEGRFRNIIQIFFSRFRFFFTLSFRLVSPGESQICISTKPNPKNKIYTPSSIEQYHMYFIDS